MNLNHSMIPIVIARSRDGGHEARAYCLPIHSIPIKFNPRPSLDAMCAALCAGAVGARAVRRGRGGRVLRAGRCGAEEEGEERGFGDSA